MDLGHAGAEYRLMEECIHRMHSHLISGVNSPRPAKDQAEAARKAEREKAKKEAKKGAQEPCQDFAAGKCRRTAADCRYSHATPAAVHKDASKVPEAFAAEFKDQRPALCLTFAYTGACARGANQCASHKGVVRLHTCARCGFKNGKHAITSGVGPGGKCP